MREVTGKGLFWKWGRMIFRFRWLVLILNLLIFAFFAMFAPKAENLFKDNGMIPYGSESDQGNRLLKKELGFSASSLMVVYKSDTLDLTTEKSKEAILSSVKGLNQLSYVEDIQFVTTKRVSDDNGIQALMIMLSLSENEAEEKYDEIKQKITQPDNMDVYITGQPSLLHDFHTASKKDLIKAEKIGIPVALVVLLVVFGTLVAAILPIIVGLTSIVITMGILYFLGLHIEFSNFLPNIVSMLGLAVGIDYALFIVTRFREELKKGVSIQEAIGMTNQTAGKSVVFSGFAVVVGLFGLVFIDLNLFFSLAVGGILVVSISVLVSTTLLLAVLSILGYRVNKLRVFPKSWEKRNSEKVWSRVAYSVMKRPVSLALVTIAGLVFCMLPLQDIRIAVPKAEILPPTYESRMGSDLFKEHFDQKEANPITIVVKTPRSVWDKETIEELDGYIQKLERVENVAHVTSYLSMIEASSLEEKVMLMQQEQVQKRFTDSKIVGEHTVLINVIPDISPDDKKMNQLIENIRGLNSENLDVYVTGKAAFDFDIVGKIKDDMFKTIGFTMGATFLILFFVFRSVVLPLKAVLMNVFSLGASLGIVVSVFQNGYFADWFDISSTGYISTALPIIIFGVVFGISMDYEVFLISRIMEEYEITGDNEQSTAEGLSKTASLITSAALILISVVGAFIFTDIELIKALGLGLTISVLLDATIIRIILVPALMKLMGRANWWAPKFLKKLQRTNIFHEY
ncbi:MULTISPECIES: MMPL family transporter [Parageobacillus]|uniref:SSD domain-containing protein n=2 Tax=Parageobacillus TaxID=1906945 RepID=A0AAN0YLR4_PARTM|nr:MULTISPECIES: MMPL family transporter [Parageobacillus]AEH49453.1 MMPL domain protein [Parageobacillus thermoglucosidasius C56-YS93]ALF09399.1 hypothetical protein AOT13_04870 [Parageobacillus thermoglucosidasius]ANZ29482.1 hypothetical protein BCV53_04880 [Parageobacillus thermoglucosidasius]APM80220.1 hypothetical protein BCV54_04885 [Parageobacillus thermoglucosidasius]KJX70238.1 hypothetical protein WH82_03465 [Parageobacillus thermoglucosidasius]